MIANRDFGEQNGNYSKVSLGRGDGEAFDHHLRKGLRGA
jgi:hypothetical protein